MSAAISEYQLSSSRKNECCERLYWLSAEPFLRPELIAPPVDVIVVIIVVSVEDSVGDEKGLDPTREEDLALGVP